jgi:hypothetical protein
MHTLGNNIQIQSTVFIYYSSLYKCFAFHCPDVFTVKPHVINIIICYQTDHRRKTLKCPRLYIYVYGASNIIWQFHTAGLRYLLLDYYLNGWTSTCLPKLRNSILSTLFWPIMKFERVSCGKASAHNKINDFKTRRNRYIAAIVI